MISIELRDVIPAFSISLAMQGKPPDDMINLMETVGITVRHELQIPIHSATRDNLMKCSLDHIEKESK